MPSKKKKESPTRGATTPRYLTHREVVFFFLHSTGSWRARALGRAFQRDEYGVCILGQKGVKTQQLWRTERGSFESSSLTVFWPCVTGFWGGGNVVWIDYDVARLGHVNDGPLVSRKVDRRLGAEARCNVTCASTYLSGLPFSFFYTCLHFASIVLQKTLKEPYRSYLSSVQLLYLTAPPFPSTHITHPQTKDRIG